MSEYALADVLQKHINRYVSGIESIRDRYVSVPDETWFCDVDRAKIEQLQIAGLALVDLARDVLRTDIFRENISYPVDWQR